MSRIAALVTGVVIGVVSGGGGMLVAYPFLFPPPPLNEAAPVPQAGAEAAPLARFTFDENAPGRDPIHWANGTGQVLDSPAGAVLRLDADFEAGPGPNFWIYLNTRAVGDEADFNADPGRIKLAPLRAFTGAQNYVLPPGVDPDGIHTVTIWCETFGVYIGSAALMT